MQKKNYRINIECGITPLSRIIDNLTTFDEVWHLPYQLSTPSHIYIFKRGKNFENPRKLAESEFHVLCPKCSSRNLASGNYCTNCGGLIPKTLPKRCKQCGQILPEKLVYP